MGEFFPGSLFNILLSLLEGRIGALPAVLFLAVLLSSCGPPNPNLKSSAYDRATQKEELYEETQRARQTNFERNAFSGAAVRPLDSVDIQSIGPPRR